MHFTSEDLKRMLIELKFTVLQLKSMPRRCALQRENREKKNKDNQPALFHKTPMDGMK